MRRAQAIVLIMALVAAPLVLAQSGLGGESCNRVCCPVHAHHAAELPNDSGSSQNDGMNCHHGTAGRAMKCQMRTSHSGSMSGPVAPIPPAILSAGRGVWAPDLMTEIQSAYLELALPGFDSPPFEPPRS